MSAGIVYSISVTLSKALLADYFLRLAGHRRNLRRHVLKRMFLALLVLQMSEETVINLFSCRPGTQEWMLERLGGSCLHQRASWLTGVRTHYQQLCARRGVHTWARVFSRRGAHLERDADKRTTPATAHAQHGLRCGAAPGAPRSLAPRLDRVVTRASQAEDGTGSSVPGPHVVSYLMQQRPSLVRDGRLMEMLRLSGYSWRRSAARWQSFASAAISRVRARARTHPPLSPKTNTLKPSPVSVLAK